MAAFVGFLTLFMVAMFPIFLSPISLGGVLVLISFAVVSLISLFFSSWYAYILFLVYIGGLLVLFIYVSMVSSNYSLSMGLNDVVPVLLRLLLSLFFIVGALPAKMMGSSVWESGGALSLGLFVGLVVLLLVAFLAVARVISGGGPSGTAALSVGVTK